MAESLRDTQLPVIVTGDLNDVAWSATTRLFRKISGLLDPRIGRGMYNTFHADYWFIRWPLDHIFHSYHFALINLERLPPFGSDHFAIFVELYYDQNHGRHQKSLEPSAKDEQWSRKKIASVGNV